jgi:hypothetical protein
MVFYGTLQGSAQGTAQGNMQGTLQGNAQGTAQGNFQGTLQGNAQATLQGNAQGNFQGYDVNTNNFYANWAMGAYGYVYANAGTHQGTFQGNHQGYHNGFFEGTASYSQSSASGNIRAWRSLDGGSQNIGYYEAQGNQGQGFCYFGTAFGGQHSAIGVFSGFQQQNTGIQQVGGVGIPSVAGTWQGAYFVYWTGTQRSGLRQGAFGLTIIGP